MDVLIADVIGDVTIVLVISSLLGAIARRCGQPKVVGQIVAGIILGPSLLGRLPGNPTARLFPAAALPVLGVLAQIAIVIFMFVVGYELDRGSLRHARRAAPLIAVSALAVPMALGSGLTLFFRTGFTALGQPHISRSLVLFMGVALSVTALPVLAAIVRERGIAGTVAGVTATAAAGVMDVAAWLVLAAALVGTTHAAGRRWPVTLLLITGFTAAMLLLVRPALRWWIVRSRSVLSNQLPLALALALGSAWVTASLGLHPVFGGLLAGLTMPSAEGTPDAEVLRPMEEGRRAAAAAVLRGDGAFPEHRRAGRDRRRHAGDRVRRGRGRQARSCLSRLQGRRPERHRCRDGRHAGERPEDSPS
jgi:Kef-type K+ transport system membrane component KefB